MGTCCCKSAEHIDKKRHPLLREVYDDSRPSKCPSNGSIQNIERRARLDAIRGPPVLIVDKLPENGSYESLIDSHSKPKGKKRRRAAEMIRSTIKAGIKPSILECPKGFPRMHWLTIHLTDFYDHMRLFQKYVLQQKCTRKTCPQMNERPGHAYTWTLDHAGDHSASINRNLNAPEYISKALEVISSLLKRQSVLEAVDSEEEGSDAGVDIQEAEEHEASCRMVAYLLFHLYAHILHWHHDAFLELDALVHLDVCFKWFIFFVKGFDLIDNSDLVPLNRLVTKLYEAEATSTYDAREDCLSVYEKSSMYSDDVSKLTMPSFDYQGERAASYSSSIDVNMNGYSGHFLGA